MKNIKTFRKFCFTTALLGIALLIGAVPPSFVPGREALNNTPLVLENTFAFLGDALSFRDLDARDAQNRPLPSAAIKSLFVWTAYEFLAVRDIPAAASLRRILARVLTPLSERFSRALGWLLHGAQWALLFNRRGTENLRAFAGILLLCGCYALTLFRPPALSPCHSSTITLPLRC